MEKERTAAALYGGEERGVGGKLRKTPARKPSATPYDRPPASQSQRRGGGWLSKLVDPACRLITGGATRIFPSFLGKSPSAVALPLPGTFDQDKLGRESAVNTSNNGEYGLNLGVARSTGGASPSNILAADGLGSNSKYEEVQRNAHRNFTDDTEFSKIEQLMRGRTFSRDEINRLSEILKSRVADHSDAEQENNKLSIIAKGEATGLSLGHENLRKPIEEKHEIMNKDILGTPTPLLQSKMPDGVGASPVDIAKTYMGNRTLERGLGSCNIISKNKGDVQQSGELALKPFIPSPSPKPSTCWPGAIVRDQGGYISPQRQRERFGLHSFPRTPYSKTIFSKSKTRLTQLQADSRNLNVSATSSQQSRASFCEQLKSRNDIGDDHSGSVGPIRRTRNKFVSEAPFRKPDFLSSAEIVPSGEEKCGVSRGFLPTLEKNLETGQASSSSKSQSMGHITHNSEGVLNMNLYSNQAVRRMLENLDRHIPTPNEKAAELRLATAWRNSPPEGTDVLPQENTSYSHLKSFELLEKPKMFDQKLFAEANADGGNSKIRVKPQERSINEVHDAVNDNAGASGLVVAEAGAKCGATSVASLSPRDARHPQVKSMQGMDSVGPDRSRRETNNLWFHQAQVNDQDANKTLSSDTRPELLKKLPSYSSGPKPHLPSISINKRDPRRTVTSDNGLGFTFPLSASSGALPEPPTPSIMPSFSLPGLPQPKEGAVVPSYIFGTKKSTRLVFSFPSTSSAASTEDNDLDLKFNFGSDKKRRLSFSLVGKGGICY